MTGPLQPMPTGDALLECAKAAFVAGDLARAAGLCRSTLAAAPRLAGPWIVLGDIELRCGRPSSAVAMAEKAIALEPQNAFAHILRSKGLAALLELNAAAAALDDAAEIAGLAPAVLDTLGTLFLQLQRPARALDMFRLAVDGAPDQARFIFNLALAERAFGALEDAERRLDGILAADPHVHDAYVVRADLRRQTPERNHVPAMEALLRKGLGDPRAEIAVRFALGKECEDLGEYARAFAHFKAGADLQRSLVRYEVGENIATIDHIIRLQSRATLEAQAAQAPAHRSSADDPIFIVGLPRSGTTLIERIVASHGDVSSAGELGTLPSQLVRAAKSAGVQREGAWVEHLDSIDLAALGHAYSRIARESGVQPGQRFIDKFPPNVLLCGVIRLALPNARIIALRRRPMDVCFGLFKTLFNTGVYPYSYSLDELADYYAAFHRLMAHWRSTLDSDRFLEVSYEEVVADVEGQSRRILAFLGLGWEDRVLRFHDNPAAATTASAVQVRRPLYASAVGRWRDYAEQLEPLRVRLAQHLGEGELMLGP